jgi:basic amino acid/polyamine antiporter, APA family
VPNNPEQPAGRSPADRWGDGLPRSLGLATAVLLVVGSTIGSGIFRTPARIAEAVPAGLPMLGVWVLGGVLALCGALTFAELAAMYPRSGGIYAWTRAGHGDGPAFLYGWSELVVIRASSLGAISYVFAEYLLRLLGIPRPEAGYGIEVNLVAAGAIAAMATLNFVGVSWAAIAVNFTSAAKFGALVLLVIGAFALGNGDFSNFGQVSGAVTTTSFGLALVSVLWAYDGFADIGRVGGEVKDPERNLPRALLIGTASIVAIYLLANAAYLYLIPVDRMPGSRLVAADAAQLLVGRAGVTLVSLAVMISTLGAVASVMLTSPRIFYAMASDGLFFKGVAAVHPRYGTPYRAIVLTAAMAVLFVLFLDFERLSDTFVLATWPFYALAAAAVIRLRRSRPDTPRPVRAWGYPVVPLVFILTASAMLLNAFWSDFQRIRAFEGSGSELLRLLAGLPTPMVVLLLGAGVPVWWLRQRFGPQSGA